MVADIVHSARHGGTGAVFLVRSSAAVARLEAVLAGCALGVVFLLLLFNIATRTFFSPVYWIDELAIYAMIWCGFWGASAGLVARSHIAITLLADRLKVAAQGVIRLLVDGCVFAFFLCLAVILWRWFDPLTFARSDTIAAYSQQTFNFIYEEPTTTVGIRKIWFWLILPLFCAGGLLHASSNIARSWLALREAR